MIDVVLLDLPCSVRGFTKKCPDGNYVIVLNSRMSREQNQKTYQHELTHIKEGHLEKELNIQETEYTTHGL